MPLSVEDVLGGVDTQAIRRLIAGSFMAKYGVSFRHGASEALGWALAFGLDCPEALHVLDIGCGIGMFARVCDKLGHMATGLDQPGYMHAEVAKVMGVEFIEHRVSAADPLPPFDPESFDVVTTMHISNHEGEAFYRGLSGAVWKALKPGGCWWFVFHFDTQRWARSPLWPEWFAPGTITQRGSRVLRLEKTQ